MRKALVPLLALAAAACGQGPSGSRPPIVSVNLAPYRIEVQQGNFISQEMIVQLKLGMSRDQVRFILGTPLVSDIFHADRWDYTYRRKRANSPELEHRSITVFFEDHKLKRIEGDVAAAGASEPKAADTQASPGGKP